MVKIKIVRRESFNDGRYHTCYDIYRGFTGMPFTWPFITKWVCEDAEMTEAKLMKYMASYLTTMGKVKVIIKAVREF